MGENFIVGGSHADHVEVPLGVNATFVGGVFFIKDFKVAFFTKGLKHDFSTREGSAEVSFGSICAILAIGEAVFFLDEIRTCWAVEGHDSWGEKSIVVEGTLVLSKVLKEIDVEIKDSGVPQIVFDSVVWVCQT